MASRKGKLIVLEGTDGTGKKTQTKLLIDRFKEEGHRVVTLSFPQYGKKSAGPVEEYLNGKYGKPDDVNLYAASLFFAVDRFDAAGEIKQALDESSMVVLDRYVDSNAGHQGGKIKNPEKRKKFLSWLYELEFDILKIPRPDLVIVLRVPAQIGQRLVKQKQQRLYIEGSRTHDGHEADLEHLKNAEQSYLWLARMFPENHVLVECTEGGNLLSPKEIHERVFKTVHEKIS